ncbi:MAG: molybdopterin converting factor subunit 1 [Gammaproteobacteria bacterium]|nr:MAG: molybdopterin converting factor subunit 1 [Gammaproteobacteria bacterium]
MKVTIKYFAAMRECCEKSEEILETDAETPQQLFEQICTLYPITLAMDTLKVAVNEFYVDFDTPLSDNDTVVFIPPVAGG